jgi:hypothetical protein
MRDYGILLQEGCIHRRGRRLQPMCVLLQKKSVQMMSEEEVNAWYDEQKQRIFEDYLKAVEENKIGEKGSIKEEQKFRREMQKIRQKYEIMFVNSLKPTQAKKYTKKIRQFMDDLIKIYK